MNPVDHYCKEVMSLCYEKAQVSGLQNQVDRCEAVLFSYISFRQTVNP